MSESTCKRDPADDPPDREGWEAFESQRKHGFILRSVLVPHLRDKREAARNVLAQYAQFAPHRAEQARIQGRIEAFETMLNDIEVRGEELGIYEPYAPLPVAADKGRMHASIIAVLNVLRSRREKIASGGDYAGSVTTSAINNCIIELSRYE